MQYCVLSAIFSVAVQYSSVCTCILLLKTVGGCVGGTIYVRCSALSVVCGGGEGGRGYPRSRWHRLTDIIGV